MYNLSIGGHEILLIVQVFALGLTLLPPIRNAVLDTQRLVKQRSRPWHLSMLLFSSLSIATWWIPGPLTRLILTGTAAFAAAIVQALAWGEAWQQGPGVTHRHVIIWLLGLLISSLAKYACHSNNPLWPFMNSSNGGQHPIGLFLAALCLAELLARPSSPSPVVANRLRIPQTKGSELIAALGMGSLLFAVSACDLAGFDDSHTDSTVLNFFPLLSQLHTFLTDSGTMIAWTWTGYPIKG